MYSKWGKQRQTCLLRSSSLVLIILTGLACNRAKPVVKQTRCHRIVSLLPSATETLFAIGAGLQVAAVTRFDAFPKQVKKLPKVGGIIDASPEAILARSPDCVVGTRGILAGLLTRIKAAHATAIEVDYSTLDRVFQSMRTLGRATGHVKQADTLIHRLKQGLDHIRQKVKHKKRVVFITSLNPLYVAGPESFIGQLLNISGAKNCVKKGKFPIWSMEEMIAADPDLIILFRDHCGPLPPNIRKWPVRAAKTGRIISTCDEAIVRPGPRLVHAAAKLYDLIHREGKEVPGPKTRKPDVPH